MIFYGNLFAIQYDEGRADLKGEINNKTITDFITAHRLPLVVEFTQETAQKIFGGDVKDHLLLFLSKKSEEFLSRINTLKEVAPAYQGQVCINTMQYNTSVDTIQYNGISEVHTWPFDRTLTVRQG